MELELYKGYNIYLVIKYIKCFNSMENVEVIVQYITSYVLGQVV